MVPTRPPTLDVPETLPVAEEFEIEPATIRPTRPPTLPPPEVMVTLAERPEMVEAPVAIPPIAPPI